MRELAPYAALGLALPGGTLIALALLAARHHPMSTLHWRRVRALMIVVVRRFSLRRSQLSSIRTLSPVIYREQNFFGRITIRQ